MACRVCLSDNLELYSVKNDNLIKLYEKLTSSKFNKDGYPESMCYICLSVLKKCYKFKETARNTNNVLKQWCKKRIDMRMAKPLTTYSVSKVDVVSMCDQQIALEHVIAMEEQNLEQDSDGRTDNISLRNNPDDSTEITVGKQSDPSIENMGTEDRSSLASNMETGNNIIAQHDHENNLQVNQNTVMGNNETRLSNTNDSNNGTEIVIKMEKIDEGDTVIFELDNTHHTDSSSKRTNAKTEAPKLRNNKSSKKKRSKTKRNLIKKKELFCNECSYKCVQKYRIIRHLRTHTGEKPFSCQYCTYRCAVKSNLTTHLRTHTGEKPFACGYCEYSSGSSFNLKMHIRTHTLEKPFACTFCDYRCAEKSNLKTHLRKHTGEKPFACDVCDFRCNTKSSLKIHLMRHSDNKTPFTCTFCQHNCVLKSNLIEHLRIHTGEKPFGCDICGRKFKRRTHLKGHKEKIHHVNVKDKK